MSKTYKTVSEELAALLSDASEVLSGDMMHLAVRRADRVCVLRYTPAGGCRETTAEDYIQDMDALEKVYACGSMTLRKDGTARAFGRNDVYGQLQIADVSLWRQAVKIVRDRSKILGLLPDGTAIAYGYGRYGQTSVFHWRGLADIACADEWAAGKPASGQAIGTPEWHGRPEDWNAGAVSFEDAFSWREDREPWSCPRRDSYPGGEPRPGDLPEDIRWSDLRQLVPGDHFTVGVRRDGTLVSTGISNFFLFYKARLLPDWRDIRSAQIIRLDRSFTKNTLLVGLTHTGEVRVCAPWGGELAERFPAHIRRPSPVVQVIGGAMDERPYLALLGLDGSVDLAGDPCPALEEMTRWQGIRSLTALSGMAEGWPEWEREQKSVILGLGFDGTVRALCRRTGHMTELYRYVFRELAGWTDIVQLCGGGDPFPRSGSFAVAGLRKDGTVAFAGGHCETAALWNGEDIPAGAIIPEERLRLEVSQWRDIRQLWYTMGHLVGRRADGTLLLSREKSY